jgi:hypothetical protein
VRSGGSAQAAAAVAFAASGKENGHRTGEDSGKS